MKIEKYADSYASLFTLTNANGMEVVLTDIGASIVSIVLTDKNGERTDVLLGYDSPDRYFHNSSSHGTVIGRIGNRIAKATVPISGVDYQMEANEGANVLHSGSQMYCHRIWFAIPDHAKNAVTFQLFSPHMDQGVPGNAIVGVTYTLDDENKLHLSYSAVSDQDTCFNLTNHSYFNLEGHDAGVVYDQTLWLDCDQYTPIDEEFIPTGEIAAVQGTPLDFTTAKPFGRDIAADDVQIKRGNGFDHNFVLNHPGLEQPFAIAESAKTGIVMKVYTDQPGVQLYSGNNMGSDFGEKGGAKYVKNGAFCLETQHYPDTPHHANFPSNIYKAGEVLKSETVYQFEVKA